MSYKKVILNEFGGPEVLQVVVKNALPEPGAGEVRVKVLAASATFTDTMIRKALDSPVRAIVESIRKALSKSSPELASDIRRRGIVLARREAVGRAGEGGAVDDGTVRRILRRGRGREVGWVLRRTKTRVVAGVGGRHLGGQL